MAQKQRQSVCFLQDRIYPMCRMALWEEEKEKEGGYRRWVYELLTAIIHKALTPSQAWQVLRDPLLPDITKEEDAPVSVVDAIWLLGVEAEGRGVDTSPLGAFIRQGSVEDLLPVDMMRKRLQWTLQSDGGLIPDAKLMGNRLVKHKTKKLYVQNRFNLMAEAGEGFTKLVAEVNRPELSMATISSTHERMMALIGTFNLDPHRVLDVLLEAFRCRPEQKDTFFHLMKPFNPVFLPQILGFKFQMCAKNGKTPASLYRITAMLIQAGKVELQEMYGHLSPEDATLKEDVVETNKKLLQQAGKVGVVSLAAKAEEQADRTSGLDLLSRMHEDNKVMEGNQKLGLLCALVEERVVEPATALLKHLSMICDPMMHAPLSRAMCQWISDKVTPLYRKLQNGVAEDDGMESDDCIQDLSSLPSQVFPFLRHLRHFLATDSRLFMVIVRLLKLYVKGHIDVDARAEVWLLLRKVVLPALSLTASNPCIAMEVFDVVRRYSYQDRYRLYSLWKSDTMSAKDPAIELAKSYILMETRRSMRRLSQENVRQMGRKLGKLSHGLPVVVIDFMVRQIQAYDNLIAPVVDAVKFMNPMAFDVLGFFIINHLAKPTKPKLIVSEDSGVAVAEWLQGNAQFCGSLFKRYPSIELQGILQYVLNQLKDGSSLDLLVLKELLAKMAGVEVVETVTDEQLEALGGGDTLRQVSQFLTARNIKRSSTRLRDVFVKKELVFPMYVMIAQQRDDIVYGTKHDHLKLIGDVYDKCHETLCSLLQFVAQFIVPERDVSQWIPDMEHLVGKYKLGLDAAFSLFRLRPDVIQDECQATIRGALKQHVMPENVCAVISPTLVSSFWSLSLYEMYVPRTVYTNAISRNALELQGIDDALQQNRARGIEESRSAARSRRKEQDRLQGIQASLKKEMDHQLLAHEAAMKRLEKQKAEWFPEGASHKAATAQFIQLCVLPRILWSQADSRFVSRFLLKMHEIKTPTFDLLTCYDQLLSNASFALFTFTENEAHRFGRFLNEVFVHLARWADNRKTFEKERGLLTVDGKTPLSWHKFLRMHYAWHSELAHEALLCLEHKDWNRVRNAFIMLHKMVSVFPREKQACSKISEVASKLSKEQEGELAASKLLATRYHAELQLVKPISEAEMVHSVVARSRPKAEVEEEEEGMIREDSRARSRSRTVDHSRRRSSGSRARTPPRSKRRSESQDRDHKRVRREDSEKMPPPKPVRHKRESSASDERKSKKGRGDGKKDVGKGEKEDVKGKRVDDKLTPAKKDPPAKKESKRTPAKKDPPAKKESKRTPAKKDPPAKKESKRTPAKKDPPAKKEDKRTPAKKDPPAKKEDKRTPAKKDPPAKKESKRSPAKKDQETPDPKTPPKKRTSPKGKSSSERKPDVKLANQPKRRMLRLSK